MVLKTNTRIWSGIILFLVVAVCFSCEERGTLLSECADCYIEEPQDADIRVKLEGGFEKGSTLCIYEGNLDDSILYMKYFVFGTEKVVSLPVNQKYTMTAEYHYPDRTVIAVNSVVPRVIFNKNSCDEPCYYVSNRSINLRLKYYAGKLDKNY